MRRAIIVANQTAVDEQLIDVVQSLAEHEPCAFRLVVPVTPLTDQEASLRHSENLARTAGESGAVAVARHRLDAATQKFAELGIHVEGDLGDPNPVKAVLIAMEKEPADVVVVATLPRGRSRWLKADVPGRLRRKLAVPVLHVETARPARRSRPARAVSTAPLSLLSRH